MDYQIHSRKLWFFVISLLLALFIVSQATIQMVSAQVGEATVTTAEKSVYAGPSESYSKVDVVYQDQKLALLGRNADSTWVYVTTPNSVTGWVTTTFIASSVPISTLPVVVVATVTATPGTGATATPTPKTRRI